MTTQKERRQDAVAKARAISEAGTGGWGHLCQRFTRSMLGIGPGYASAIVAWAHVAKADRHGGTQPPAGVPVYWAIGNYGHAALSDGAGYVWSTDIKRAGCVDRVSIAYINRHWGAHYLGWAETCNGHRVYGSAP